MSNKVIKVMCKANGGSLVVHHEEERRYEVSDGGDLRLYSYGNEPNVIYSRGEWTRVWWGDDTLKDIIP